MLDIRAGRTPVTEHHLVDFLNPPPNSPTAPDKSKDFNGYHPPELLSPGDLADQDAEVEDAIVMLQNLAIHPEQGVSIVSILIFIISFCHCSFLIISVVTNVEGYYDFFFPYMGNSSQKIFTS